MEYIVEGYDPKENTWKTIPYYDTTGAELVEYPLEHMAKSAARLMSELWGGNYRVAQQPVETVDHVYDDWLDDQYYED